MFKIFTLVIFMPLYGIAEVNWTSISHDLQRTGSFNTHVKSTRLDFTGLVDVSHDDPDKIFHSSGRSVEGKYEFGFSDIKTLNLFSGALSTGVMVDNGVAYFATNSKQGVALNLKRSEVLWSMNLKAEVEAEPVVTDQYVYFCDKLGHVTAISKASGGIVWQLKMKEGILAHPLILDHWLVIADQGGLLQIVDTRSHQKSWSFQLPSGIEGTPMIVEGKLWVASLDGVLYRFDMISGLKEFQYQLSAAVQHGMCLVKSETRPALVVVGTKAGMLHSFDLQGRELPHSPIDLENQTLTPIASRGLVYVCNEVSFFQIDPWLGEALFEFTPSGQNFFGDLVFDGHSIHALVLKNSPSTTAKIIDLQFSFLDDWQNELVELPLFESNEIIWDGKLEEREWEKATQLDLKYTAEGGPHFEKIFLKVALSQEGVLLAGSFMQGGIQKDASKLLAGAFEVEVFQKSLNLDAKLKLSDNLYYEKSIGVIDKNLSHKYKFFRDAKKQAHISFEHLIPVSIDQLNQHQVFELKASFLQKIGGGGSAESKLIFYLNPGKEISSLLLPQASLK